MKKVREIITVDTRISLFQTAMNNAGRNFEGKRISVKKMADFATDFYKLAIKEINEIGKIELEQLRRMSIPTEETQKVAKRKNVKKLLKKVANRKNK